jgi:hypothetical protein
MTYCCHLVQEWDRTGICSSRRLFPQTEPGLAGGAQQTLEHLRASVQSRNLKIFAQVDHSDEAEQAGLEMPPAHVLIFGSPKAGTPLMLASPLLARSGGLAARAGGSTGVVTVRTNAAVLSAASGFVVRW